MPARYCDPGTRRGEVRAFEPGLAFRRLLMSRSHKNDYCEPVFQFPRSACADHRTENQAEIECADVNQLPLEDVLVAAQMRSPHSAGIVTVREAPLDQLASLAQQALAISP